MTRYKRIIPTFPVSPVTGPHMIPTNVFNDDPKFIFIHIPKTAGSSIQKWLHVNRFPEVEEKYPENWDGKILWNIHGIATEYRAKLEKSYGEFFKFAFVRNPWDRMYSLYRYLETYPNPSTPAPATFEEYVLTYNAKDRSAGQLGIQTEFILDAKGKCIVDFVGRFENLYDDLQVVAERIKIKLPPTMYRENTTEHNHYREYYTTETREAVETMFKSDIDYFTYEF